MSTVVVIGGGPAGMVSAIISAQGGNNVILLEKNEKLGKKLFITGKGRCNLTNNCTVENVLNNTVSNSKFLYSALNTFSPSDCIAFFEGLGLELKTERGNRVFPKSDKSSDVIKSLTKKLTEVGVDVRLNTVVTAIDCENGAIKGVIANKKFIKCDKIVIATGGISYPLTGSTGDGYRFASSCNHDIIAPIPALNGIVTRDCGLFCKNFTLKNVSLTAKMGAKSIYNEMGEILLTEYGISGPLGITCSSLINRKNIFDVDLFIDFKTGLTVEKLDKKIVADILTYKQYTLGEFLPKILPSIIAGAIIKQTGLSKSKRVTELSIEDRSKLCYTIKNFKIKPIKLRPIDEAIVTAGGVSVKQINPKTMESKLISGLFFAGEVIDVDAFTGGYNIQIALSTGYTAGLNT